MTNKIKNFLSKIIQPRFKKVKKEEDKLNKKLVKFYKDNSSEKFNQEVRNKYDLAVRNLKYFFLMVKRHINLMLKPDPENIAQRAINNGLAVVGIFLVIFIIWGVIAKIDSASIAQGKIVLDFNKKTIQHLEGGIVEQIPVKEGQKVVTGQEIIHLRDTQSKAQSVMLRKQLITTQAIEIRLKAERDRQENINFDEIRNSYKYDNAVSGELEKIISTQQNLFSSRRSAKQSKIDILNKRIDQLRDEIRGLRSQKIANQKTLDVLTKQQKMTTKLVKDNNTPLNKLLEIEKQVADIDGKKGELEAMIAKAGQTISETKLEIVNLQNEGLNEVQAELQDIEVKISDLTEQLTSASDILKRTVIRSPISGVVMELKYHTIGAVIPPGGEIMYIVPNDDELIIEARINPQDIDNVKEGQKAKIQLTAYKAKKVPKLIGELLSVSADIILDEVTGEQYFLARVKIDDGEIKKLRSDVKLYPGMPAQVFIITGSRSLMNYIFSPISDSAYKAFREE